MTTNLLSSRKETRRSRYERKKKDANSFPVELVSVNFEHSENVGFMIRGAACFGAEVVNIIGTVPEHKVLVSSSGTTQDFVTINQFSNPYEFLTYARENDVKLVCAELYKGARSLWDYEFPKIPQRCAIIVGHETVGVPIDLLVNSDVVYIPMPGAGFCLNTAVSAQIMLHEYVRQQARNQQL